MMLTISVADARVPSSPDRGSRGHLLRLSILLLVGGCSEPTPDLGDDPQLPSIAGLTEVEAIEADEPLFGTCKLRLAQRIGGTDEFGEVWDIFPLDDTYILAVDHYVAPMIRVIDQREGRLVQAFGEVGAGPREFESPSSIYWSAAEPGLLELYDRVNQRATRYTYDGGGHLTFAGEEPLRIQEDVSHIRPYGDGYMGNGAFPYHTLSMFDPAGRVRERWVTEPMYGPDDSPGRSFFRLFNKSLMHSRDDRVAVVYWSKSYIDLVDLAERSYRRVAGPRFVEMEFEIIDGRLYPVRGRSFSQGAYNSVVLTDRLVYALFDGEERNGLFFVQVFAWDGRYIVEYELDQGIAIVRLSPDERTLYGNFEDPYPRIGKWTLPPLHEALDRLERGEDARSIRFCPQ